MLGLGPEMGGVPQLQPFPLAELHRERVDGKWNCLYVLFNLEAPGELLSSLCPLPCSSQRGGKYLKSSGCCVATFAVTS